MGHNKSSKVKEDKMKRSDRIERYISNNHRSIKMKSKILPCYAKEK